MVPPTLTPLSFTKIQDLAEEALGDPNDDLVAYCKRADYSGVLDRCPDITVLEPADILLFASDDGPIGRIIQTIQTDLGYDQSSARFVHAALFLGEDRICHARADVAPIQRGIRIESIFSYSPYFHSPVAALRIPDIADADRVRVALAAACKTGLPYDFSGVLDLCRGYLTRKFPNYLDRFSPETRSEISNAYICSDLIETVYDQAWPGKDVLGTSGGSASLVLPADIAKSTTLIPIEIPVCRIS